MVVLLYIFQYVLSPENSVKDHNQLPMGLGKTNSTSMFDTISNVARHSKPKP